MVNNKLKRISTFITALGLFLLLIFAVVVVYTSTHYAKVVNGASMYPTLNKQATDQANEDYYDIVLVSATATPQRGNIIIVDFSEYKKEPYLLIKRLIAVGGDTLNIKWNEQNNELDILVNGKKIIENYVSTNTNKSIATSFEHNKTSFVWYINQDESTKLTPNEDGSITIPKGYYFALGDNRGNSSDCLSFGPLPTSTIIGVVDTIVPYNSFLFKILHNIFGVRKNE